MLILSQQLPEKPLPVIDEHGCDHKTVCIFIFDRMYRSIVKTQDLRIRQTKQDR
jgi:hypothetical protein